MLALTEGIGRILQYLQRNRKVSTSSGSIWPVTKQEIGSSAKSVECLCSIRCICRITQRASTGRFLDPSKLYEKRTAT
jgi:hypothetical protein